MYLDLNVQYELTALGLLGADFSGMKGCYILCVPCKDKTEGIVFKS